MSEWESQRPGGREKANALNVIENLPQAKSLVAFFKNNVPFERAEFIGDKEKIYGVWGEVGETNNSSVMEISIQGLEKKSSSGKVVLLRIFENKKKYQEVVKQEKEEKEVYYGPYGYGAKPYE